jgi:integrating conjugative element protein (TIGR03746 family)
LKYRDALTEMRHQRNVAWLQFGAMTLVALVLASGWYVASRELPALHIPPDVSEGVIIRPGEVPTPNVYAFALYTWQQVNRWPSDGTQDYPAAIYRFTPYLTPRFREELLADMHRRARAGELDERVRGVQEIPGHHFDFNRVDPKGEGVWVVWLDLAVEEHYRRTRVKETQVRYPLRVVRLDVDKALNPFGLALDGFATRAGELDERVRGVQEIPGHHYDFNRVDTKGDGVWVVWLDLAVEEHYRRTRVKETQVRYPLRVVRLDVDKALNPFGLALDGFATRAGPRLLNAEDVYNAEE